VDIPPSPPRSICLLRLSALGDVTHVLPLVQTLRSAWPETALTWVIGRGEFRLLEGLQGVEFAVYDKTTGFTGMRALRHELVARTPEGCFDALLHMQVAARANLISAFIPARQNCSSIPGFRRAMACMCSIPWAVFVSRWV